MFTNLLPDSEDYRVVFSDYATTHHIKRFAKAHKGKRWMITQDSIFQDLKRMRELQHSQQVDELKNTNKRWLFKYDFAIAQSHISSKKSGNRCLVFLDGTRYQATVLAVYGKDDLPKNQGETAYLLKLFKKEFPEFSDKLNKTL